MCPFSPSIFPTSWSVGGRGGWGSILHPEDSRPKGSEERGCRTGPGCSLRLFHTREKHPSFVLQPLSSTASVTYGVPDTYDTSGRSRPWPGPAAPGKSKVTAPSPDTGPSRFVSTRRESPSVSGRNKVAPLPSSLDKRLCRESSGHGEGANYQAPGPARLPTCLSSSRKMSFRQRLCQEAEGPPASLHKDSPFVTPLSAAKKSLFLPEGPRGGGAAGRASEAPELPRPWAAPPAPPRAGCQGYERSDEEASAGQVAQVRAVKW